MLLLSACRANGTSEEQQLAMAQAAGCKMVSSYWYACVRDEAVMWELADSGFCNRTVAKDDHVEAASTVGAIAAILKPAEAAYRLGSLYAALLPARYRAKHGIYYTPPAIVARLLAVAEAHGLDWQKGSILDPACGGGAFMSPVAVRMMEASVSRGPEAALRSIERRLVGFELDPFGAWCAQVFAEVALLPLCKKAGRRLRSVVQVCDSLLQFASPEKFDLVVGNPPYGRTRLRPGLREKYERALFGHANLYTLFTDLSLRLAKPTGLVSLVTPTSFLAGEYFKSLRHALVELTDPVNFDFVSARKGVFDQVLQETVLATYRKGLRSGKGCTVNILRSCGDDMFVERVGKLALPEDSSDPWPLPRSRDQLILVRSMKQHRFRLRDYGYEVATGQLVWNRHKDQLRSEYTAGLYPLIWAESIGPRGEFEFRAEKRNHKPFFAPRPGQEWLVTTESCILLQRTTAKEQTSRLIAAVLPGSFLETWGGVVVENHVNIIRPIAGNPELPIHLLAELLNSDVLDQTFRCLNGSVAVSAYELNALPLPEPSLLLKTLGGPVRQEMDLNARFTEIYMHHPFNEPTPPSLRQRDPAAAA